MSSVARPRFFALALALALAACAAPAARPSGGVCDLEGRRVDPLASARPVVLVFADPQCPISNAYAPELRRIAAEFAPRGVEFFLVYADPARTPAEIRAHAAAFGYDLPALRDPRHELALRAGATLTPEACVFRSGELVYRGRIDDRFVAFGKQRIAPTVRDLCAALEAVLAGTLPTEPWPPAIGCSIPEPGAPGTSRPAN